MTAADDRVERVGCIMYYVYGEKIRNGRRFVALK